MRKLFLTHFKFRTGGSEFEQYRLTILNKEDLLEMEPNQSFESFATEKAVRWFNVHFPESEFIYCMAYQAIDDVKNDQEYHSNTSNWYDAGQKTYTKGDDTPFVQSFPMTELPPFEDEEQITTDDVVVDMDGNRKYFLTYYYSKNGNEWVNAATGIPIDWKEIEHARWYKLPLAKYDKQ